MKRILGIIVAVLGLAAFFSFLTGCVVAKGFTIGVALLIVLISVAMTLGVFGFVSLIRWLLG